MSIITINGAFGLWLIALFLGGTAKSSSWQNTSPAQFSFQLTTEMLMVYAGMDFAECVSELVENPKRFTAKYDSRVADAIAIANEALYAHYDELITQKNRSAQIAKERKQINKYVKWLYAVTQSLLSQGNYTGASAIASVLSLHLDYNPIKSETSKTMKGVTRKEIETLFANLLKMRNSQLFERLLQKNGVSFLPNMFTLRNELEFLSGDDFKFKYDDKTRRELANAICSKLSRDSLSIYKTSLMLHHQGQGR